MFNFYFTLALLLCWKETQADTPANCSADQIVGKWHFLMGQGHQDNSVNCSLNFTAVSYLTLTVSANNSAVDHYGNNGTWTMIYNQGFETNIAGRKYFGYSAWKKSGKVVKSICSVLSYGWSHDALSRDWACFRALKLSSEKTVELETKSHHFGEIRKSYNDKYKANGKYVEELNSAQTSWDATIYKEHIGQSIGYLHRMAGGVLSQTERPPRRQRQKLTKGNANVSDLPETFDWRNVDGRSFISPVENQGGCGSCYSFSSTGMLEARVRIMTNNAVNISLSQQQVVSCSQYSQGCEGGFPYLVAGKFAQDFGFFTKECYPYEGTDSKCKKVDKRCTRLYVKDYGYVGKYYGGCNENAMKEHLVKYGPLSVSFEVYQDFMHYKGGVYHHTGLTDSANQWEMTNHAVLLVGYGATNNGEKYWTVKNSWGEVWGEKGYFRIARGQDECAIESMAVWAEPMLTSDMA